ncbi:hypothetical protein FB45DRAFT_980249 [Roridomyces roridus]|uniref:Elongation factor methyltransferase 7 n=1 Tax=Roridomyces roridus TaxID=1738132 RepID=A0AAD7BKA8_9AGAR|nr:hypothetical protein FB45DRAFT_980249 [Roridomyces roridus]
MDSDDLSLGEIFPEEARPPTPEPSFAIYQRDDDLAADDWRDMKIRLVGSHPLWGHYLWNAARAFASYLDHNRNLYRDRFVLELGAGGGLPGLVAAKNGAKHVLLTDYPDPELVKNMEINVAENAAAANCSVQVYSSSRYRHTPSHTTGELLEAIPGDEKYHLILLSDLGENNTVKHDALLKTCENCLAQDDDASVLVFYTHHRPHLADKDMEFFSKARARGWACEEIVTRHFTPMFPEDPGEASMRGAVHGWRLLRAEGSRNAV